MPKPQTTEAAAAPSRRLPYPFEDVEFEWDASESGISLLYAGDPSRLIECGAIEPDMAEKAKAKSKLRVDSAGHYYHRDRWVDTETLTAKVTIIRSITDEAFAKTLPGAPRGLRFKFLDWLDAHPDRIHLTQEQSEGERHTRTFTTGAVDTLIAAGFLKSLFEQRFHIHGMGLGKRWQGEVREKHVDPKRIDSNFGYINPLMRGYFEVVTYSKNEAPATKSPRAKGALRLIVNNDSA
jgi:hypothetical protein